MSELKLNRPFHGSAESKERAGNSVLSLIRNTRAAIIVAAGIALASVAHAEEKPAQQPMCAADKIKNVDGPVKEWLGGKHDNPQAVQLQLESTNCTADDVGIDQNKLNIALSGQEAGQEKQKGAEEAPAAVPGEEQEVSAESLPENPLETLYPRAKEALLIAPRGIAETIFKPKGLLSRSLQDKDVPEAKADKFAELASTSVKRLQLSSDEREQEVMKGLREALRKAGFTKTDQANIFAAKAPDNYRKAIIAALGKAIKEASPEAQEAVRFFRAKMEEGDAEQYDAFFYLQASAVQQTLEEHAQEEQDDEDRQVLREQLKAAREQAASCNGTDETCEGEESGTDVTVTPRVQVHWGRTADGNTFYGVSEGVEVTTDINRLKVGITGGAAHLDAQNPRSDEAGGWTTGEQVGGLVEYNFNPDGPVQASVSLEAGSMNRGFYGQIRAKICGTLVKLWGGIVQLCGGVGPEVTHGMKVDQGDRLGRPLPGRLGTTYGIAGEIGISGRWEWGGSNFTGLPEGNDDAAQVSDAVTMGDILLPEAPAPSGTPPTEEQTSGSEAETPAAEAGGEEKPDDGTPAAEAGGEDSGKPGKAEAPTGDKAEK